MESLLTILGWIGVIVAIVGELWILATLVKDSKLLFLLSILVPPIGQLLFLVFRFHVAWKPVSLFAAGVALALGAYSLLPPEHLSDF